MPLINTPLKWAGGKTRIMPDLLKYLPEGHCLIEPFVGSGAVFMNTSYRRYVLSDSNPDLINMHHMVVRHTAWFIDIARTLFRHGNNRDYYERVRVEFNAMRSRNHDHSHRKFLLLCAAQFLYLNRHCYNGLCRYSKKTGFNVSFGKYKNTYFPEKEIRLFAEKANDVHALFICMDCMDAITLARHDHVIYCDPPARTGRDHIIYCDPPCLPVSETSDFTIYHAGPFYPDRHRRLVDALTDINRNCGVRVVISGSDTAATREIYQSFSLHGVSVYRSIAGRGIRGSVKEVIGVLKACDHGGILPDCAPMMGDAVNV